MLDFLKRFLGYPVHENKVEALAPYKVETPVEAPVDTAPVTPKVAKPKVAKPRKPKAV
jgi:hypothetical protein